MENLRGYRVEGWEITEASTPRAEDASEHKWWHEKGADVSMHLSDKKFSKRVHQWSKKEAPRVSQRDHYIQGIRSRMEGYTIILLWDELSEPVLGRMIEFNFGEFNLSRFESKF